MTKRLVGLTGGIGSGKSTVANMLTGLGAGLVDADKLAHAVTAPGGNAIPALAEAFGPTYITPEGALDRTRMRGLVFDDPQARQRLQAIVHPLVGKAVDNALANCSQPVVVVDVPLLVESSHWRGRCDRVVVVDCTTSTQVQRVQARNGWSAEATLAVIQAQATRSHRLAAADAVINNNGHTLAELSASVRALARWLGL